MTLPLHVLTSSAPVDPIEEELMKDIWDVRRLPGVRYAAHRYNYILNFSLAPASFRSVLKRYFRLLITRYSLGNCADRLAYLRLFLDFYSMRYVCISHFRDLSRADIEAYLVTLKMGTNRRGKPNSTIHQNRAIHHLRLFLEYLERSSSLEAPQEPLTKLIWPEDGGQHPCYHSSAEKYIPEIVLNQLEHSLHLLPATYLPVVVILRASGWRIGDILNLRYDTCLERTQSGWWLCGDILKTQILRHKVPLSDEIAAVVAAQREVVKAQREQENPQNYLFPATTRKRKGYPVSERMVRHVLNQLAVAQEIKTEDGTIFHFKNHAFRHSKAVELLNAGMSLIHVQKWLAHLSPEMTLAYAKLLDSTRRKEWEQAFLQGAVRIDLQGVPKGVSTEQLCNEQTIEWEHIRHNLDAVRLADGYCFKSKKAQCPTQDSPCYTCHHFCTTPEFLPQFEKQKQDLDGLIALGEKAGSQIWIDRNTQKLNRILPVIQILKAGNLHHPAGKIVREYTPEERAKRT